MPELEANLGEAMGSDAGELAELYFWLGEKDRGFEWLERAYARKEFYLMYLKIDSFFDDVRSDPRFLDLMRSLGLG